VFGAAARKTLAEAYVTIVLNYQPGDRLFLVGFGRSAAIAVQLAQLLSVEGIPEWIHYSKDEDGRIVHYEFACPFKGTGTGTTLPKSMPVDVEMLGLFDTVATMKVPTEVLGIDVAEVTLLTTHRLPANVRHAYHAVAIDEKRIVFAPHLFDTETRLEEVWFPGVHHAVGGGYTHQLISDIPLRWLMDRAERHGLKFHGDSAEEIDRNLGGLGVLSCEAGSGPANLRDRRIVVRGSGRGRAGTPRVHTSAVARMKTKSSYRPANLAALGARFQVIDG
jgi:uncharacterized protein (DUF2235 family)